MQISKLEGEKIEIQEENRILKGQIDILKLADLTRKDEQEKLKIENEELKTISKIINEDNDKLKKEKDQCVMMNKITSNEHEKLQRRNDELLMMSKLRGDANAKLQMEKEKLENMLESKKEELRNDELRNQEVVGEKDWQLSNLSTELFSLQNTLEVNKQLFELEMVSKDRINRELCENVQKLKEGLR